LDKIDREITSHRRFIESPEAQLAKVTNEIAPLRDELAQVEATIRQQENEKAFAAWRAQIEHGLRGVSEAAASTRIGLGEVNALAVAGEERFGGQASMLLSQLFEEFHIREANPEKYGLRPARPIYSGMPIHLHPMARS
jgi:septal ring factor EnvC (AmiA/AmiB activator)